MAGRKRNNERFRLVKRGKVYYARFLDQHGRVVSWRSTGHTAKDRAWSWAVENADGVLAEAGLRNPLFTDFLADFWSPESTRSRNRAASGKALSAGYLEGMQRVVRLHVLPWRGWRNLRLNDVTPRVVLDYKLWIAEHTDKRRTANLAIKAVITALRWAQANGETAKVYDYSGVGELAHDPAERGVLTPAEVSKICKLEWSDKRQKAALILGIFAGLRRGEIRGLRWGKVDLQAGTLYIDEAINREGEVKAPKQRSKRTVPLVPQSESIIQELRAEYPYGVPTDDDFVLCATPWRTDSGTRRPQDIDTYRDRPISGTTIKRGWERIMDAIGVDSAERQRRAIVFHSTRHTFAQRISGQLPILVAQRLTGHRTREVFEGYAGHESAEGLEHARKVITGAFGEGNA